MSKIDFNALRDRSYKCACDHGFHDTDLSNGHLLMLVITELSEAVEADRKGKYFKGISTFEREFNRYSVLVDENTRLWTSWLTRTPFLRTSARSSESRRVL